MSTNVVKVTLWGQTVGYLQWDSSNWKTEGSVFQFEEAFLDSGLDISPLLMSINNSLYRKMPRVRNGNVKGLFKGLPPVFADSLPDHWGTRLFRAWANNEGVKMSKTNSVDFLSFIGTRGMGALEYYPALINGEEEAFDVDVEKLYSFAKSILEERSEPVFEADKELLWQDLVKLGTSPGGKRPKALIAINKESNEIKSGQAANLPEGFEHYILKYDNEKDMFPYALMEYAYYLMCRDCNIRMETSELRRFNTSTHFITKRFDRNAGEKIHMQSLRALCGGASSYEEAFDAARRLGLKYAELEQLYKIMVFNVIAGNIDDHDGNISFLMDINGKWSLAPAYDMVYSISPDALYFQKGQFMSINGKKQDIMKEDLIQVGRVYGIRNPSEAVERSLDVVSHVEDYLLPLGVDKSVINSVTVELNSKYKSLLGQE